MVPFGLPVEPDVNIKIATSSGDGGSDEIQRVVPALKVLKNQIPKFITRQKF